MKQTFYWSVAALALYTGTAPLSRAQDAVNVSSATDAAVDASGSAAGADSAAGVDINSGIDSSGAEADLRGSATTESQSSTTEAQSSTYDGASTENEASAGASTSGSVDATSDAATGTVPEPAASTDAAGSTQANAGADTARPSPDVAAGSDAAADIQGDANVRGDADVNVQAQTGAQQGATARQDLRAGLQFGQATNRGLALNSVARSSYFYNSGLRPGDVLVAYAGRPIRSQSDFSRWVVYQPGQRVPVVILRDGRQETIYVTYHNVEHRSAPQEIGYASHGGAYLGLTFDASSQNGALVRSVAPGGPAERAGIQPGHVIVAVNGEPVNNHQDVIGFVAAQQPGSQVDLAVAHTVVLGSRPGAPQAATYQGSVQPATAIAPPVPTAPGTAGAVQAGSYQQDTGNVRVDGNAVVRPGDADRDGRVLDGDGRIGPRARARAR